MSHFSVAVIMEQGGDLDALLAPYQENNMGDVPRKYLEFVEDEDFDLDSETGKRGYWENPNAKWDCWTIGGRWRDMIRTKFGDRCNQCLVREIDIDPTEQDAQEMGCVWDVAVDDAEQLPGRKIRSFHKPEYYPKIYGNKETFVKYCAGFYPFAFITSDGEWHEEGRMGWFGCSDTTNSSLKAHMAAWEAALEQADPEYLVVLVDCHI